MKTLINYFRPAPLSFRERRELILKTWQINGYQRRALSSKSLVALSDRLNRLAYSL